MYEVRRTCPGASIVNYFQWRRGELFLLIINALQLQRAPFRAPVGRSKKTVSYFTGLPARGSSCPVCSSRAGANFVQDWFKLQGAMRAGAGGCALVGRALPGIRLSGHPAGGELHHGSYPVSSPYWVSSSSSSSVSTVDVPSLSTMRRNSSGAYVRQARAFSVSTMCFRSSE